MYSFYVMFFFKVHSETFLYLCNFSFENIREKIIEMLSTDRDL